MNPAIFPGEPGSTEPAIEECDSGDLIGADDWHPCTRRAVYIRYFEFPEDATMEPFWVGYCAEHYPF